jgi:hypothetical protein
MFGGCPTRRGQSPFTGPDVATVKWSVPLPSNTVNWAELLINASGGIYVVPYLGASMVAISSGGTLTKTYGTTSFGSAAIGADGTLYVPTAAGITALDPTSGVVTWSAGMQSNQRASVAIAGDGNLFSTNGNNQVFAVTPGGAVKWTAEAQNTSPAIAPDGTVYVAASGLVALHPDGSLAWTNPTPVGGGESTVGHDGTVYTASGNYICAFKPDGTTLWAVELTGANNGAWSVSIAPDDTLYVVSPLDFGTALYHLSASDGSTLWQFAIPSGGGWLTAKPVIDALGRIYVTMGGWVYALRCDGTQMWTFPHSNCYDPVIGSDGRVYVPCADAVYALGP